MLTEETGLVSEFQQLEEVTKRLGKHTDEPFKLPAASEQASLLNWHVFQKTNNYATIYFHKNHVYHLYQILGHKGHEKLCNWGKWWSARI